MENIIWKGTVEEAEENEIEYYASVKWSDSARNVEQLRKMIWNKEYENHDKVEPVFRIALLTEDRDDIE
ncbi:hypothetical protein A9P82_13340 [Arachidicoccus ginsenosidimutans]|uniref:hypothetical protein n=1 Tax=Arachidicoccus sp. BS20 TaxID=1850526 RepID=UPI0007F0CD65|nr:hypothetical protein [Arachidicoccus sp. BS20]ANI90184.1 hypothetical protein A9P82_13340 [Arachidicoccus sp. BS20]